MLDAPYERPDKSEFDIDRIGVKASQFSFARLQNADPVLGVDMSSTGEVGCLGDDFRVSRDVLVDGIVAIPRGTIAKGTVYEAKRSTAFGTKGRLGIKVRYLTLPSGENISFASSDIYIQGQNRTALSALISIPLLPFPEEKLSVISADGHLCKSIPFPSFL